MVRRLFRFVILAAVLGLIVWFGWQYRAAILRFG